MSIKAISFSIKRLFVLSLTLFVASSVFSAGAIPDPVPGAMAGSAQCPVQCVMAPCPPISLCKPVPVPVPGSVLSLISIIKNIQVTPTNGGINPSFFALQISGKVLLGNNACEAHGITASMTSKKRNGIIFVTTYRHHVEDGIARSPRCPKNFAPVYADVMTVVRADRNEISDVIVKNVKRRGRHVSALRIMERGDGEGKDDELMTLTSVSAEPTNGGFNPNASAYKISGTVLLGANPCDAAGRRAELRKHQAAPNDKIYVSAVRLTTKSSDISSEKRICTTDYRPVFAEVAIEVRGLNLKASEIIVKNVEKENNDVSVAELLAGNNEGNQDETAQDGCMVGGCSGQLCGDANDIKNRVTTCEFTAKYACYKQSRCERQATGQCGWSQTKGLTDCLANPPALQ
jgi:hypothetical protein